MKSNVSAYILCGGKSTRMGTEKGLVDFHGKPFVRWILDALFPLVSEPVLVTKNQAYQLFQLETISDLIEGKGPMGGIYTALKHASADLVLVLSCDIPKINQDVLAHLVKESQASPEKITFLSDGKNDYPLIGIYPKGFLESLEHSVLKGELKLRRWVESMPYQRIILNPKQIRSIENINTLSQLQSLS